MAAPRRARASNRRRAGYQAAAAPDDEDTARLPRPLPGGARGIQRGRKPAIAARGLASADEPGDRLDGGRPGRRGMPGEARACLAALADERASSGEVCNARAVIC